MNTPFGHIYWTPYRGIDTTLWRAKIFSFPSIEPLIGGLIRFFWTYLILSQFYWTPYRGIDTVFVLKFHSFNTYWTPYRGIDTFTILRIFLPPSIEPLIGGLIPIGSGNIPKFNTIEPLIGGLIRFFRFDVSYSSVYWTPYRGIDTSQTHAVWIHHDGASIEPLIGGLIRYREVVFLLQLLAIEPLIGGLIHFLPRCFHVVTSIEPLIGGLIPKVLIILLIQ